MKNVFYKLVVFVPQTHLEQVRIAVCNAGAGHAYRQAGKIGNYDNCAFMTSGVGTFKPLEGAKPFQGSIGKLERVGEARLEVTVAKDILDKVIEAVKMVHPYEEPVYDIYKLENV